MTLTAAMIAGQAQLKPLSGDAGSPGFLGFLGVVMLDTRFPRPPGDVGHPDTFDVATRRYVVRGAWPAKVVQSGEGLRAALVPYRAAAGNLGQASRFDRSGQWQRRVPTWINLIIAAERGFSIYSEANFLPRLEPR